MPALFDGMQRHPWCRHHMAHGLMARIRAPCVFATANNRRWTMQFAQHRPRVGATQQGIDLRFKLLGCATLDHFKDLIKQRCSKTFGMHHTGRPQLPHFTHAMGFGMLQQFHALFTFLRPGLACRNGFITRIEQRQPPHTLRCQAGHFKRNPPAHGVTRQRKFGRTHLGQHFSRHSLDRAQFGIVRHHSINTIAQRSALMHPYGLIAQQTG